LLTLTKKIVIENTTEKRNHRSLMKIAK